MCCSPALSGDKSSLVVWGPGVLSIIKEEKQLGRDFPSNERTTEILLYNLSKM